MPEGLDLKMAARSFKCFSEPVARDLRFVACFLPLDSEFYFRESECSSKAWCIGVYLASCASVGPNVFKIFGLHPYCHNMKTKLFTKHWLSVRLIVAYSHPPQNMNVVWAADRKLSTEIVLRCLPVRSDVYSNDQTRSHPHSNNELHTWLRSKVVNRTLLHFH